VWPCPKCYGRRSEWIGHYVLEHYPSLHHSTLCVRRRCVYCGHEWSHALRR
jgi:hypothetical protein